MSRSSLAPWLAAGVLLWSPYAAIAQVVAPAAPAQQERSPAVPGAQIEIEDDVEEVTAPTAAPVAPEQPPAVAAPASAAPAAAPSTHSSAARIAALEQRSQALEAKLAELQAQRAADGARERPKGSTAKLADTADTSAFGLHIRGYLQAQYESSQFSEDQLQQGGLPLNRDRFVLRRARLRIDHAWRYAAVALELDANTVRGATFGARRAYGVVRLPGSTPDAPPYLALTAGLQDIAFGYEITQGSENRIFMERSLASVALFPGEPDVGATVWGGYGPIRYAVAVLNGQPVDDRTGGVSAVDPNAAKDVVARVGAETAQTAYSIAGGVSFLTGRGFHAGAEATKNQIGWIDQDEDAFVDDIEITAEPGRAAERSQSFDRWAVGADLRGGLRTKLGWSRLYAEITLAENLDRGLFVADPVGGPEAREIGYALGFVQEVTPYGLVGFRTDFYDGNSDFTDSRRGQIVPADQSVRTYSPLIGAVLPEIARLVLQYDIIGDHLARDTRGVPTDLRNNQWTLRLQVAL